MPRTIVIQAMSRKEITVICNCSYKHLCKQMKKLQKVNKDFRPTKGEKLSRTEVKMLFDLTDILPLDYTVQD